MAPRKTAVPEPEAPVPYQLGISGEDVQMPRLRVVGKLSKLVELDVAKSGDLAIGADAEDEDSQIIHALNGKESLRIYVIRIHANYACGFAAVQNNPQLAGQWEEGDPECPPEAKRQYNYTLYCPEVSDTLPVVYTASGTAAREARNKINTKLATDAIGGGAPYERCFSFTTKINTAGQNSWPGPVFSLTEPDPAEVAKAKEMHDSIVGPARTQISDGEPGF